MAYIGQEEKKKLTPEIKKVLDKYGVKGSISIRNHMVLVVKLKSGKLDFLTPYIERDKARCERQGREYYEEEPREFSVGHPVDEDSCAGEHKEFFNELLEAMRGGEWFDKSDIMTDYFHTKHYTDIYVGTWEKPYEYK